jgi:hypothetical protein
MGRRDMGNVILEALAEWFSSHETCFALTERIVKATTRQEMRRRRFMNKIGLRILAAQVMRNAYERYKTIDPDPVLFAEAYVATWYQQAKRAT